jgi:predicted nuclease of predicted toxin-antitoxin system
MIKLKLDENFSPNTATIFKNAGFDTHTVIDENLSGADDTLIYAQCLSENRCLITFDTDFCDILRFPSETTEGIIVIRPKRLIALQDVKNFA